MYVYSRYAYTIRLWRGAAPHLSPKTKAAAPFHEELARLMYTRRRQPVLVSTAFEFMKASMTANKGWSHEYVYELML